MAIYISKNALAQNPLNEKDIDVNEQKEPVLKAQILDLPALQAIASNDLNSSPITVNNADDFSLEIIRVKMALNIIDDYGDIAGDSFNIPGGYLITNQVDSGNFDTHFINALNAFQTFAGITMTTEIDSRTLSKIDMLLDSNVIFDRLKNNVIGRPAPTDIRINSNVDQGGNAVYTIEIDGEPFPYVAANPLSATPIIVSQSYLGQNEILIDLQDTPQLKSEIIEQQALDGPRRQKIENAEFGRIYLDGLSFGSQNEPIIPSELPNELAKSPPRILPDKHAKLHLVQAGDQLDQLIANEYYNNQPLPLIDEYSGTNNVIYTFPPRTLNPDPATRQDDARYQFYLNLIYYYNTPEDTDGTFNEYGIKKVASYNRYQDDHLNAFNLYDNEFSSSDPESVLPNYYRFLKAQEQNGTSIQFDTSGNPTSFQLEEGKYMWIPSREFSEGLYYHMNFRHSEMLLSDVSDYISQSQENLVVADMEAPSIWDFIEQNVTSFVDYLKGEVIELFEETLDYFRTMYAWAINTVAQNMFRGLGGTFGAGIGVTWGYPIATDFAGSKALWRKMTRLEDLTFVFREDYQAFVGFDSGVGGSVGFKFGSGNKTKPSDLKVGVGLAGGIQAGARPNVSFEYEFPIRPEETALIVMCINVFGGSLVRLGASFLGSLNVLNLDPRQYLTWSRMGVAAEGSVWGIGQLGFDTDAAPKENTNVTRPLVNDQLVPKENDKSFLSIDNIWDNLPGIGLQANGKLALGVEIEYRAKYDDKPLVPEINGRVPSEVEVEQMMYFEGETMVSGVGNFIQNILITASGIGPLLSMFNFNAGFGVGAANKFTRNVAAKDLEDSDINFKNAITNNAPVSNANNGGIQTSTTGGSLESQLFVTKYSGDVDGMFVGGSEVKLKFDLFKLRDVILNDQSFFNFNVIDNILELFHSIEFQYLPSLGGTTQRSQLAQTFFSKIGTVRDGTEKGVKRKFLDKAYALSVANGKVGFNFDAYAGGNIKMELKLQNFYTALKYFLRRWYLMIEKQVLGVPDQWETIKKEIDTRIEEFNKNHYVGQDGVLNTDCYPDLYDELNQYLISKGATDSVDYREVAIQCLTLPAELLRALLVDFSPSKIKLSDGVTEFVEDLRLKDFIKALTTLTEFVDTTAAIEAMLGTSVGFGGNIAIGAKARLALSLNGAIIYRNVFLENNVPLVLPSSDELSSFIRELNAATNISSSNQRADGIRQALNNISN
jgi:hypothetical protein